MIPSRLRLKLGPYVCAPVAVHQQPAGPRHASQPTLCSLPPPSCRLITQEALSPDQTLGSGQALKASYLVPKGIGDSLREIATQALGMAYHPDVL